MRNSGLSFAEKEVLPSFKVILLGASSVGKTSIMNRFMKIDFEEEHMPTTTVRE